MDDAKREEIREERTAYLAACKSIEAEALTRIAYNLVLTELEVRSVWFEIQGGNN